MFLRIAILVQLLAYVFGTETCHDDQVDLPKVRIGGRVIDILNGKHFDEILEETPDGMRPPGVVLFYDSFNEECSDEASIVEELLKDTSVLPDREGLMVGRYDMVANELRTWYEFTPEMNLTARMGITSCPELVFVPPHCRGNTEWCVKPHVDQDEDPLTYEVGCEDFVDHCGHTVVHKLKLQPSVDMLSWLKNLLSVFPKPTLRDEFSSMDAQRKWLRDRDITTTDNQLRNLYFPKEIPKFTKLGFEVIKTPPEFEDWLLDFYERYKHNGKVENWHSDATQLNFHVKHTTMFNLDQEYAAKVEYGDRIIKPILEKWSGIGGLTQTSFYGIRKYDNGMNLKEHIDRIDTHVISATISLRKMDPQQNRIHPWPIQVISWDGKHVRYNHDEGTTVLYESARLAHGRPYPNRGGPHLGCFIHFKPTDDREWKTYVSKAKAYKNMHMEWTK